MAGGKDTSSGVRVWVDDQHPIFRRGLIASLVSDGFAVVGETAEFRGTAEVDADIILFAVTNTTLEVIDSIEHEAKMVALVAGHQGVLIGAAIEKGADAILGRADVTPLTLSNAMHAVMGGVTMLPGGILPGLLEQAANGGHHSSGGLSDREVAVLRLLAEGDDTRDIAGALSYSERTVKNVVHDVLMKMNCRNRAHAVALATRQGVI